MVRKTDNDSNNFILSEDQKRALKIFKSGKNLFIFGKAGSGKSFLISEFQKMNKNGIIYLAPTGIAAININGSTIHRFFKFPIGFLDHRSDKVRRMSNELYEIVLKAKTIVIDEISMVRADLFESIDSKLRFITGSHKPFGGKQIIIIGDIFQLPPVLTPRERAFFYTNYNSPYFFTTDSYADSNFKQINLVKIFRQKDKKFLRVLNDIRNKTNVSQALKFLNKRVRLKDNYNSDIIHLCTTNKLVAIKNEKKLKELKGIKYSYNANITGDFKESECTAPKILELKLNARVMALINNHKEGYYNSSLGTVINCNNEEIKVKFDNGTICCILKHTWEIIAYIVDKNTNTIEKEVIGTCEQYPIKLAYSVSIHKSQGQTLENAVVDLGTGTFVHGQLYVALSRVKSLKGLFLKRPIQRRDIIVDSIILNFFKENKTKENKTKENKTKENKTKENKTKENKTKETKKSSSKLNYKIITGSVKICEKKLTKLRKTYKIKIENSSRDGDVLTIILLRKFKI